MKSFNELAKTRRSLRTYSGAPIPREHLELCVDSARHAPSACNVQPWKFIIIDSPEEVKNIGKNVFTGSYKRNEFASGASAFIIITGEREKLIASLGGMMMKTDFRLIDIGIACAHIVLQAQELGIGSCILGWFDEKKLKNLLGVPRTKRIELVISLGYPRDETYREKTLKDRSKVISYSKY